MVYDLINYFDVWADDEGGWQVNNLCVEEEGLYIDDTCTEKEILQFLVKIGFLVTSDRRKVYLDNLGDGFIEIYQKKGNYPLGRLQAANIVNTL